MGYALCFHNAHFFAKLRKMGITLMSAPVFTITGYSNTGKTTYLEKLIPLLKVAGLRVAVVKHDGHDFQADIEEKDSWRFAQVGAEVVAVASQKKAVVFQYRTIPLNDIISQIYNVDIILTEGYKSEPYPKIAIFRAGTGKGLSVPAKECMAIVGDYPEPAPCPVFPLNDARPLAEFLLKLVSERSKKTNI